jgi:hypothetical protein
MNKPKNKTKRPAKRKDGKQTSSAVPILLIRKGASLKAIYAAARQAFSAADLQKYTETEEGIPARQILAKLEVADRVEAPKRSRKSKNDRSR